MGGNLLIATHLDESNFVANQKPRAINKYVLTMFIKLFQASSRAKKHMQLLGVTSTFQ
jgi:hypothetical protein